MSWWMLAATANVVIFAAYIVISMTSATSTRGDRSSSARKGIPAGQRDRVFERFVRLHSGGAGIGLGLYICRLLMAAMGGSIAVADSNAGARICCRLPGTTGSS